MHQCPIFNEMILEGGSNQDNSFCFIRSFTVQRLSQGLGCQTHRGGGETTSSGALLRILNSTGFIGRAYFSDQPHVVIRDLKAYLIRKTELKRKVMIDEPVWSSYDPPFIGIDSSVPELYKLNFRLALRPSIFHLC